MTPLPPSWLGRHPTGELAVDQAGHSAHPCRMLLAMLAVGLGQTLVAAQAVNRVFDANPTARKGMVIGHVLGWTGFAARLFVRTTAQGMQLINALIARIADGAHPRRQVLEQPRPFQQLQVCLLYTSPSPRDG